MSRPLKRRRICEMPQIMEFSPNEESSPEPILMTVDEYEAIRLIDYLGYSQEECATRMNIARTTVQLIYDSARKKLATALVCSKRLKIDGGVYELCPNSSSCCGRNCHSKTWDRGNSFCNKDRDACDRPCQNQPQNRSKT